MHIGVNVQNTVFTAHDRSLNIKYCKYGLIHENESAHNQYNALESQQPMLKRRSCTQFATICIIMLILPPVCIYRTPGADNCHNTHLSTSSLRAPPLTKKTLNENHIFANKVQVNTANTD